MAEAAHLSSVLSNYQTLLLILIEIAIKAERGATSPLFRKDLSKDLSLTVILSQHYIVGFPLLNWEPKREVLRIDAVPSQQNELLNFQLFILSYVNLRD